MHLDGVECERLLKSMKNICKESKLKEFQFNLINRIVVYGIKTDNECLYCGDHDSIDHLFKDCNFVKRFVKNVIDWFKLSITRTLSYRLKKNYLASCPAH